ncbi:hypothetical protein [Rhizobium leguminosarum]|uniref:hypothetical protein n=1 Tax=Rhizobium leguminosarum TaxID=384 RepID=UPI00103F03A7|nr:hypothetical protein [Rhizobium leguminosarum]MBB4331605.1 hypothetical protein [Rhizobium leguminosarum]MBB4357116.1 hypothetical protein [Rhizobium leguminosarum]MBB4551676.1 hypothetical protein [Rhizobium leguminosarum]MBB4564269.1 hypothetical protein [Rhizobium leguminosarum]TBZ57146.1 hypothetical protein E0H48_16945 [Rhizobium leguminosarum bv. viciae]
MTKGNPAPEVDWKLVVRSLKGAGTSQGRMLVEKAILEAAGFPLRLREARRRLFILTTSASEGRPAIVETEGGLVCVIALDDLVDVVMEPGPTLAQVMEAARGNSQ